MLRSLRHVAPVCALLLAPIIAPVIAPAAARGDEAQIDLSHLYGAGDATDRRLSYSELRALSDLRSVAGAELLEAHFDGRFRYAWNDLVAGGADVTRLYVQYGNEASAASLALGRQSILSVAGARVDGAHLGFRLDEGATIGGFGGVAPHPITGELVADFPMAGAAYEVRSRTANHAGGGVVQWYGGGLDRAYLSERAYLSLGPEWILFGSATIDLVPLDPTNLDATIRYKPSAMIDFSLTGTHFHTILPNRWWQDWIAQERARLGFSVDGEQPLGTRRSSARLVTNLHLSPAVTPYAIGRYDHRHSDTANGWEAQLGLKIDLAGTGYLDVSFGERMYFESENRLAAVQLGASFGDSLNVDAGFTAMYVRPFAGDQQLMIYDASLAAWLDLSGMRLMGQYQAFIEPELFYQVVLLRIGYRYRD